MEDCNRSTSWLVVCAAIIVAALICGSRIVAANDAPRTTLIEMAAAEFKLRELTLSDDERRLFAQLEVDSDELDTRPKTCRAACLRWLCSDPKAAALVPHRGLRLVKLTVVGRLDLRFLKIPFPICLWQSSVPDGIDVRSVEIPKLDLRGTTTTDVAAENLQVKGDLLLSQDDEEGQEIPFDASARVMLGNASIGGDLGLTNARFSNYLGVALQGDGLHVGGSIYMGRAQYRGQLQLVDATVGGMVVCSGATFAAPASDTPLSTRDGAAARFDRLAVGGDLLLDKISSGGEIRIINSKIGGNLDCSGATLVHPEGEVLSVARSSIDGHLFLDDEFRSNGRILLQQSHIHGNLTAEDDVELSNSTDEAALEAVRLVVDGDVRLQTEFVCQKNINLTELKIGGDLVFSEWKPALKRPVTIDLRRTEVEGRLCWYAIPQPEMLRLNLEHVTLGTLCEDETFGNCRSLQLFGMEYKGLDGDMTLVKRLQWLREHSQSTSVSGFVAQPYEAMAAALRNAGDDSAARRVEVAKEEHRKEHAQIEIEKWVWYRVIGPIIGYGYSPLEVLNVAAICIAAGAFVFTFGRRAGLIIRSKKDGGGADGLYYPRFNPLIYSLETFAPLLKMYTAEYWTINTDRRAGRLMRWYLWAHILLGWMAMSVLIAGMAGLVHK